MATPTTTRRFAAPALMIGLAAFLLGVTPTSAQLDPFAPGAWQSSSSTDIQAPAVTPNFDSNSFGSGPGSSDFYGVGTATTTPTNIGNPAINSGYCAGTADTSNVKGVFKKMTCIVQKAFLPLLFSLALLFFLIGAVKFTTNSDSSEREEGQQFMIWGVVALTVLFCIWGLVNLFRDTFKIQTAAPKVSSPRTIQ